MCKGKKSCLKPCPFCGAAPVLEWKEHYGVWLLSSSCWEWCVLRYLGFTTIACGDKVRLVRIWNRRSKKK